MTAQPGKLMLIKQGQGDDPLTYVSVCGITGTTLSLNSTPIDVTTPDCTTPANPLWRKLISGGIESVDISGPGTFTDSAAEQALMTLKMSGDQVDDFQVVIPDLGTIQGKFHLSGLEYSGTQDGAVTYSITLASAGAVTFTAAA